MRGLALLSVWICSPVHAESVYLRHAKLEAAKATINATAEYEDISGDALKAMDPNAALQYVKKKIDRPDWTRPVKLQENKMYYSQDGQDKYIDQVLHGLRKGFVVEAGAYDGETLSNSLFFERSRDYRCLLVEPNPDLYRRIVNKNRRCFRVQAGISTNAKIDTFPFQLAGVYGGFTKDYTKLDKARVKADHNDDVQERDYRSNQTTDSSDRVITVEAYPFNMMMQSIGVDTVDVFSLDTEGSELGILRAINFQTIQIGVICVEHNAGYKREGQNPNAIRRSQIKEHLQSKGFKLFRFTPQDDFYGNVKYFNQRGIPFPQSRGK